MDFDIAWCPACDKQIAPKRYTIKVPREPPPPPPPSPKRSKGKTGGLVNGTGRLRHNGTIKAPPAPPVIMKERTVIEQGPTPLYCSDECQFADLHAQRRDAPMDPAIEEPQHDSTPTSVDKFLKFYNLPPLPKVPSFAPKPVMPELPWTSGIMMAGKLIDSLCPPPQKPYVGKYRPVEEPRQPTKGWNDGSNAWRDAVYSKNSHSIFEDRHPDAFPTPVAAFSHRSSAPSFSTSPTHPVPVPDSEKMLADFAGKFVRSNSFSPSEASSRAASSSSVSSAPSSSAASSSSAPSPRRERSLVHKAAEGMLVVPNIKLKVNSGASSSSLTSGYGSRRSVRSPLSATSMSMSSTTSSESGEDDEEDDGNNTERCVSSLSKRVAARRALPETRSWSYDNMLTYDAMPVLPQMRKVKKPQLQIIDGKERIVDVEVEELHERKCLFTFAPNLIKTSSV